jgi:serine/threonine-protein kinase
MTPERWARAAELYESALAVEPTSRAAFLADACHDDSGLRREVESLLAQEQAAVLVDDPVDVAAAAVLGDDAGALRANEHLGPYRIEGFLGAGGMGQVYRATDTRLQRTVALKVLPTALARDPQFRARFEREAQAIGGLTHPHICTLYDVGRDADVDYLVLEYLEGETLASRLGRGPLSVEHALACTTQIVEALDAAHRRGIVHRDLKPGNVFLLRGAGALSAPIVKLLDFGLAKSIAPAIVGSGVSQLPTTPRAITAEGVILGTFQYMAPEQLEGRAADARTDIFAFGAVAYEMLTGKKAFEGKSQASLIGAIMHVEPPPISATQSLTPPSLDYIVKTCLAKDPDDRWQTARDLLRELKRVDAVPANAAPIERPRTRTKKVIAASIAGALLLTTLAAIYAWRSNAVPSSSAKVTRFTVTLPDGERFSNPGGRSVLALSPGGTHIAYIANGRLYIRALDQLEAAAVRTDDDANVPGLPTFSPDSQWVAFLQADQMKKVSVTGGAPVTLGTVGTQVVSATWASDNSLVLAIQGAGIMRLSGNGGAPEWMLKRTDIVRGAVHEGAFYGAQLLPGLRAMLFTVGRGSSQWNQGQIVVRSLDTGEQRILVDGGTDARYLPTGHLVYARQGTVFAAPFDPRTMTLGASVPVLERVAEPFNGATGATYIAIADDGTVAYIPNTSNIPGLGGIDRRTLVWVDRRGNQEAIQAPPRPYLNPRLSPDGSRIAVDVADENRDVWIWDVARGGLARLTSEPGLDRIPLWTPDGRRIIFSSDRDGRHRLYSQPADGSGGAQLLNTDSSATGLLPSSISADGKLLVARRTPAADLLLLAVDTGRLTPLVQTQFSEVNAEISGDSRWMAYQSTASGQPEIYVRPFPDISRGQWQVSTAGGVQPLWSRDGRELFFRALDGALMSVQVNRGSTWAAGPAVKVLDTPLMLFGSLGGERNNPRAYDVSPDGRRFLMVKRGEGESPDAASHFIVIHNWFAELKRRVPVQ